MSGRALALRCEFCLTEARVRIAPGSGRPVCPGCDRPFLLDRPRKVSQEDFQATVLEAEVPVLVDFYADWCGPCKWLNPYLEEVAREGEGRVLVAKVDTDKAPQLAERYRIGSIPTVILFRSGEEAERSVGVEPDRVRAMAAADGGVGPGDGGGSPGQA
jgi:thioredoxin